MHKIHAQDVTMWLETFQFACHDKFLFGVKICTNMKINMEREYPIAHSF
jgi:hypothetical protein